MVNYCRVSGCHNRSDRDKDRSYFRIPQVILNQGDKTKEISEERRRLWLAMLDQDFTGKNLQNIRVCSDHFISHQRADLYDRDNPDWVPSKNMSSRLPALTPEAANDRYQRRTMRNKKSEAARTLVMLTEQFVDTSVGTEDMDIDIPTEKSCQTDMGSLLIDAMEAELQELRSENVQLKEQLRNSNLFSRSSFEGNDDKVKLFTGLSCFSVLLVLFNYLEPYLPTRQSLDKFECMTMALVRLRLSVNQLTFQLNISRATVSRIFSDVMDTMYIRMKPFVHWPDRDFLRKAMPIQFQQQFGSTCAVIIDCFEVFIERPSNLKARAETWSSYKHHNTLKFLIGITPQGVISFISKSWGGRSSDKCITENCGVLEKLLPGDIVLADRGFDIQSSVGSVCAQMKMPAFTKGKSQLSPLDVEETRRLANVRIHVERVIGLVRQKYTMLNGTLPLDLLITKENDDMPTIDKIAHTCCSLVNLCESVVDFEVIWQLFIRVGKVFRIK